MAGTPRMDQVHVGPEAYDKHEHRTSLAVIDNGRRSFEGENLDKSATMLQSTFRGHLTRKQRSPETSPERLGKRGNCFFRIFSVFNLVLLSYSPCSGISPRPSTQSNPVKKMGSGSDFLYTEDKLRSQMNTSGSRALADLTREFQTVDSRGLSLVFATLISYAPTLSCANQSELLR